MTGTVRSCPLTAAIVLLTAAMPASSAIAGALPTYSIVAPPLTLGERVIALTINTANGRVAQLLDCPSGWDIAVDNDPCWRRTRPSGNGIVGAAAIDMRTLPDLFRLAPKPSEVCLGRPEWLSVAGTLTVLQNGEPTELPPVTFRLVAHALATR